ncbi:MAG: membrane protein insertase YidC [Ruminiclostridium sp.]|nr:membrane protein insertase YidC [Ruminiclostridium sp.]
MSVILTPFAKLVLLFYNITGSYGVSLILFSLVIRAVLFPLFLKGRKSMLAMNGLAEQQKILQQKYARDRERYSVELQKLYEQEGVKPSGGCLWSFLPVVFLMPLYAIVRRPLTYLLDMSEDSFNAVSNLLYGTVKNYSSEQLTMAQDVFLNHDKIVAAIPDLANMPAIDFTFLGMNLSETPHLMFWQQENVLSAFGLWLIPIISAILGIVSMLVTNKINGHITGVTRAMDTTTRSTMLIMPLMSLWICFTLPAALGLYWVANSVFAILAEFLNIPFLKKYLTKLKADKAKRIEDEKERVRNEKKAQAEAKKKAQEEMRRIQMERKLNQSIASASRIGMRTYARGRLYDPDRYPSFPYQDPNKLYKEELEKQQALAEETKNAKQGKKSGKEVKEEAPVAISEPVVEIPREEPVILPEETAPVQAEEAPAEKEAFVEESFLETTEDGQEET